MPKVRPLGDGAKLKARWNAANASFDRQIGRLMGETRCSMTQLAEQIGVTRQSLAKWRKDCSTMTIASERKVITVFEKYGVPYDRTMGEGTVQCSQRS